MFALFEALSYLFLSTILFRYHFYFIIFSGFFLIMSVDSFSRYFIDPIKITICGILSTLCIVVLYLPDSIVPYTFSNGDKSLSSNGPLVMMTTIFFAYMEILWVYQALRLFITSSSELKKYSSLNLIGAFFFGIIPVLAMATRFTLVIPGCGFIAISLGAIISTTAFALQPKLRDVLLEISRDIRIQMRKQLEDQISEKEEQYQFLYTSMSEGVSVNKVLYNDEGEIVDFIIEGVNPAYEKLFKTVKIDAIGLKGSDAYKEYYQIFLKRYNQAKTEGKPQVLEVTFQKIKKILFISLFIMPKEGQFANIFMDVTAERKRGKERIKSDKIKLIGDLAGELAHGFNNLLTSIIGNIELAKLSNTSNSQNNELSDFLSDARNAAFQGKDLANYFLTFAEGGAPIKKTIHIEKLLRDGAKISLIKANIKSDFNISKDLWLVDCDEGQIQQAMINLLINAKESMLEGGKIEISAVNEIINEKSVPLSSGKYVKITIKDNGVGIPPENIERIFDPFFSTKQREDQKGMGLGLTITHSIIKRHNGHLIVTSKVDVGTTIEIYLPASESYSIN